MRGNWMVPDVPEDALANKLTMHPSLMWLQVWSNIFGKERHATIWSFTPFCVPSYRTVRPTHLLLPIAEWVSFGDHAYKNRFTSTRRHIRIDDREGSTIDYSLAFFTSFSLTSFSDT